MTDRVTEQDTLDLAFYLNADAVERVHGTAETPDEWVFAMAREVGREAVLEVAERVHVDLLARVVALLDSDPNIGTNSEGFEPCGGCDGSGFAPDGRTCNVCGGDGGVRPSRYQLLSCDVVDGDLDLDLFYDDNPGITDAVVLEIAALPPGGSVLIGGGAAALFVVRRTS